MKRFVVFGVIVLAILTSLFIVGVSATDNVSVWDGSSVDSSWYNKSASTLYIDDAADFAAFITSGKSFSGKTVVLRCDIVWNTGRAEYWSTTNAPENAWTALTNFRGTLDGGGHYVSGIYYVTSGTDKAGFFTEMQGANVHDLAIVNSYICADQYAGGIAGMSRASNTISNVYLDAYVHTLTSTGQVGGLVGQAYGNNTNNATLTITGCEVHGVISSDFGGHAGSLVGLAKGSVQSESLKTFNLNVTDCFSTATVSATNMVGGFAGKAELSNATFDSCYYNGKIYSWSGTDMGAIIAVLDGNETYSGFTLTITKCYYNGVFYKGSGTSLGGFYEFDTCAYKVPTYGSVAPSSNYYTDSARDSMGSSSGTLNAWLSAVSHFAKDIYGNVRLTTLDLTHDCSEHYGKWLTNGTGQRHQCTYGGCMNIETRDASFALAGVSVRYDDPAGIRFLTKVNKNQFFKDIYTGDDNNYTYSGANITFGTLIIPKNMLIGELTISTPGAIDVKAKKVYNVGAYTQTSDIFYYTAVLTNFPESINTYNRDLVARSYAKYVVNNETVYIYTDTASTSFYKTAEQVYPAVGSSVKAGLNMILALGSVNDKFYDESADNVIILQNATPALFNNFADSLVSQGFTRHTNYEASDNKFGLYYNDDFVVTFYYTPKTITNYYEPDTRPWYDSDNLIERTEDMSRITGEYGVTVDDAYNIMRVIVEKRAYTELPATSSENIYTRNNDVVSSIGYIFPNDNYQHYGMGYIVQLADGSFIILDGGENIDDPRNASTDTDSDLLYQYLVAHKPASHEKPVIAAWIFTHRHNDHVDVAKGFMPEYGDQVVVEQVIYNFAAGTISPPAEDRDIMRWAELYFPEAKIVTAHTGYKFYIRNAELTIRYSIDDLYPFDITKVFVNNESIVFDMVIDNEQRIMFCGEVFVPGSRALVNMYGSDLASDVLQMSHHGHYGATEELYRNIWPASQDYSDSKRFVLWPIGNEEQLRNRLALAENFWVIRRIAEDVGITWYSAYDTRIAEIKTEYNTKRDQGNSSYRDHAYYTWVGRYITGKTETYNNERLGFFKTYATQNALWKKVYANCQLIFESGAVTDTVGQESDANIVASGAIGTWKTIPLYTNDADYDTTAPWPWG